MRGINQTREETYILQLEIKMKRVELNNKWNFIKSDGTYLSDTWFDGISCFIDGFGSETHLVMAANVLLTAVLKQNSKTWR